MSVSVIVRKSCTQDGSAEEVNGPAPLANPWSPCVVAFWDNKTAMEKQKCGNAPLPRRLSRWKRTRVQGEGQRKAGSRRATGLDIPMAGCHWQYFKKKTCLWFRLQTCGDNTFPSKQCHDLIIFVKYANHTDLCWVRDFRCPNDTDFEEQAHKS